MAKKPAPPAASPSEPVEQLNALIPVALKRRIKIAAVNADKSMTDLLIEWIETGLSAVENPKGGGKSSK